MEAHRELGEFKGSPLHLSSPFKRSTCFMSMSVSQREQVCPWMGSAGYRMAQKNFFSLKGFSDAGTGDSRGSSLAWASQYDVRSAAALETWCKRIRSPNNAHCIFTPKIIICSYSSHLYPVNIGLHLELLHQFASLSNASSVVGGHEASGSGLLLWNTDGRIHSVNVIYRWKMIKKKKKQGKWYRVFSYVSVCINCH